MSDSDGESSFSRPTTPVTALPDTARPFRFTWDPASRRPGPESVSGTTADGYGDYFATRPGDLHLNTSTTNLGLGVLPTEWSSTKHGFNAISTVLNNPHKRQAPPKAHSSLPSVPPAELPRVRRKDFDAYLQAIGPEWEKYEQGLQQLAELDDQPVAGPSTPRASMSSFDAPHTPIHASGRKIPPLDIVPRVFFEPKFDLGNPRTFAAVTEQDTSSDPNYDPTLLSHSLPLLEKFSHYADTIELHLTHEISLRSSSFFAALSNLHHLEAESASCLSQVTRLRKLLVEVDDDVAKRGLATVRMERKLHRIQVVEEGVNGIKEMVETTAVARGLVSGGQWGEALGLVESLEEMWTRSEEPIPSSDLLLSPTTPRPRYNGKLSPIMATPDEDREQLPPPNPSHKHPSPRLPVPLSSLLAFSALPSHLRALTLEITSSLTSEFVSVLREDLLARIEDLQSGGRAKTSESVKERLSPLLDGLIRTKGLREAGLSWREVVLAEIRNLIAKSFPTFQLDGELDGTKENGASSDARPGLANHLRTLPHVEFMVTLRGIYSRLLNLVEGLQAQGAAVGELLEAVRRLTRGHVESSLETELAEILSSAAELSHAQAAKIVSLRVEQHATLQLPEFVEFFNESWSFVVKGEVVCRRMIVGLRGVVVSQAKVFLQSFHQSRLNQSAKLVEDELWNSSEVPPALQRTIDILVESAVKDAQELLIKPSGQAESPHPPAPISEKSSKHIKIEDRTYFTVPATSDVLRLTVDYLKVIVNLNMLTTETMSKIIEFLKAFNSRTCQVVLGAGAMRSAGLKNITAKHLALASQSLSIMVALIPYIRETFRKHLSQKQAAILVEFDKLKRDYQEHQNEIYAKLIAIMGDRLTYHIKSLNTVDWTVQKPGVNAYMELLVKETETLYKVLTRYLASAVVEDVMTQVLAAINHRLSEEYMKLDLPDIEAKNRLLADARFLRERMSGLKNIGAPSGMLETVIRENTIPRSPYPQTPLKSSTISSPPPSATPSPSVASTISTNQRLKGLLSGRALTFDKALPTPGPTSETPTPPPRTSTTSPPTAPVNGVSNGILNGHATPPLVDDAPRRKAGFKQVEISVLDDQVITEEPQPLPAEVQAPEAEEESVNTPVPRGPEGPPEPVEKVLSPGLSPVPPMSADITDV